MLYRDYPKGDARRYFLVLTTIDSMPKGEGSIHRIAAAIDCTRAEAQRAVQTLVSQFGVTFDRDGSAYVITSWGVLKKPAVVELLNSPLVDTKIA